MLEGAQPELGFALREARPLQRPLQLRGDRFRILRVEEVDVQQHRPELLEQAGLLGGLAALADEFRVNSMIDIDLVTNETNAIDLSPDQTGQLLVIAREALSNIARHSKATRGSVEVEARNGTVRMLVSDNGVGFDPDRQRGPSHQGLTNMRARVAEIDGTIEIQSSAGGGTRIIVSVERRDATGAEAGQVGDE